MAIYHYSESNVSRSTGRSACASVAYISGSAISDARQGMLFNYGNKSDVVSVYDFYPEESPSFSHDRESFWNEVARAEDKIIHERFKGHPTDEIKNERSLKAREAALESAIEAHSIVMALPKELTLAQGEEVVREFIHRYLKPRNLAGTMAVHADDINPHAHILVAPRSLTHEGFSRTKCRDFNSREELKNRRELWAYIVNEKARELDLNFKIDHRSYADQGLSLLPTQHEGWYARKVHKGASRLAQENAQTHRQNLQILFENPDQFITLLSRQHHVVTHNDIATEVFKRVGGDDRLFELFASRLDVFSHQQDPHTRAWNEAFCHVIPANREFPSDLPIEDRLRSVNRYIERLQEEELITHVGESLSGEKTYLPSPVFKAQEDFTEKAQTLSARTGFQLEAHQLGYFTTCFEKQRGYALGEEQIEALKHLTSESGLSLIEGRAGTGKTTVLEILREAYEACGYRVLGTSFQGRTAEHLEVDTGISSQTLHSYKRRWDRLDETEKRLQDETLTQKETSYWKARRESLLKYELDEKTVMVIDEGFMVPSHLLHDLLTRAVEKGAKVVMAGDSRQILSFNSWDAGRALLKASQSCSLEEVRRQKVDWQREASLSLSRHALWEGYAKYEEKGAILVEETEDDAMESLAKRYVDHVLSLQEKDRYKESLLLAYKNVSVKALNTLVVDHLKQHGALGKSHMISQKGATLSELKERVLEHLDFTKKHGIVSHLLERVGYLKGRDVFEFYLERLQEELSEIRKERTFYEGQRVVFTSNDHAEHYITTHYTDQDDDCVVRGVKNGTCGTLLTVEDFCVQVRLDDRRIVSFDMRHTPSEEKEFLESGHALTIHKSQGLTVDHVFGLFEHSHANLQYVLGTRHRLDFVGAYAPEEDRSFKEFMISQERPDFTPLASDYHISDARRPAFERVRSYVELSIELYETLNFIGELKEGLLLEVKKEDLQDKTDVEKRQQLLQEKWTHYSQIEESRKVIAEEMFEAGLEAHRPFLEMAGLTEGVLLEKAGIKKRPLSVVERSVKAEVSQYVQALEETREAHRSGSFETAGSVQEKRNELGFKFSKDISLYRPFLKEMGVSLKTIEAHKESHLKTLKQQSYEMIHPDLIQSLKGYIKARGLQRGGVGDQTAQRDAFAFDVIEKLQGDHGEVIEAFLSSKGEAALLHHAMRHEMRVLLKSYQDAKTIQEKGCLARSLLERKGMGDLLKAQGVHSDHLIFESALEEAVRKGELSQETANEKVLVSLEAWKASDLERREMFVKVYQEREKIAVGQESSYNKEIVQRFQSAGQQLYSALVASAPDTHQETSSFHLIQNVSRIITPSVRQQSYEMIHPDLAQSLKGYIKERGLQRGGMGDQTAQRDAFAFDVIEKLQGDHGEALETFLSSKGEAGLLQHAMRHEMRVLLKEYQDAKTIQEKGCLARSLLEKKGMGDLLKAQGVHSDHLIFESTLEEAVRKGELSQEAVNEKVLPSLESWKASDLERRAMFVKVYQEREKRAAGQESSYNKETIQSFQSASRQLYGALGTSVPETLEETPSFKLIQNVSQVKTPSVRQHHQRKDRPQRLSPQAFDQFIERVNESVDMEALSEHVLAQQGIEFNKTLSRGSEHRFGQKGSVRVTVSGPKKGHWYSFEEGTGGNALSFVKHYQGTDFKDSLKRLHPYVRGPVSQDLDRFLEGQTEHIHVPQRKKPLKRIDPHKEQERHRLSAVQRLAEKTRPLKGTQAQAYLEKERGLSSFSSDDLRYIPEGTRFTYTGKKRTIRHGALAVLARDQGGALKAIQLTYLNGQGKRATMENGKKLPKITYGVPKGAFVTLSHAQEGPLFLSEGVETGLSLKEAGMKGSFKAALGVQNMGTIESSHQPLILVADYDGENAQAHDTIKNKAKSLQDSHGYVPEILWPKASGSEKVDFNDVLKKEGADAVKKTVFDQRRHFVDTLMRSGITPSEESPQAGSLSQEEKEALAYKIMRDPNLGEVIKSENPAFEKEVLSLFNDYEDKRGISCLQTLKVYGETLKAYQESGGDGSYLNYDEKQALGKVALRVALNEGLVSRLQKNDKYKDPLEALQRYVETYVHSLPEEKQEEIKAIQREKVRLKDERSFDPKKSALEHLKELYQMVQDDPEKQLVHKERIEKTAHGVYNDRDCVQKLIESNDKPFNEWIGQQCENYDHRMNIVNSTTLARYVTWDKYYESNGGIHNKSIQHMVTSMNQMAYRILRSPDLVDKALKEHGAEMVRELEQRSCVHESFHVQSQERGYGLGHEH